MSTAAPERTPRGPWRRLTSAARAAARRLATVGRFGRRKARTEQQAATERSQTLRGKVVSALNAAATEVGAPTVVFAGQVALTPDEIAAAGIAGAHSIVEQAGSVELAMSDARAQLTALATRAATTSGEDG